MIIGLGLDAVEIARVERMLAEHGDRLLARLFTPVEVEYAMRGARPAEHLAARLAAKEAVFKALAGTPLAREIGWRDIEVRNTDHGVPQLQLTGRARARASELDVGRMHLSLTHTHLMAVAVVVLER